MFWTFVWKRDLAEEHFIFSGPGPPCVSQFPVQIVVYISDYTTANFDFFFVSEMKYAPLHTFWDAGQETDHERAEQFSRKINKRSTYITHYIRDMVYAYWLFLVKCVASSPADCTQVQENLSLPCNNSPSTSMISVCRGVSSPLLRYHDQNVRRAHRSVPHSLPKTKVQVGMQKLDL